MESILGIFKNLDALQWVMLAGGLFLLWPTIQNKLFKKDQDDNDDKVHDHDLTELVCKWECLCDACHNHGLHDACGKLKEVFPMLIKPYEKDHDKPN